MQDIAGGLVSTLPSLLELENPETSGYVRKYLGISEKLTADDRMRIFRLAQQLCGHFNGNVTIHGEGSMAAQRMMLYANADWERYKALAKRSAGIKTDHPLVSALPQKRGGYHYYDRDRKGMPGRLLIALPLRRDFVGAQWCLKIILKERSDA